MIETDRPDHLYELLPPIYRTRDAEQNYPLRDLLRVVAEQSTALKDDIWQRYNDWFIETCADWAVPYIGDLISYRAVRELGDAGAAGAALESVLEPRREVANTIRFRRRKGTLAVLQQLAAALTGWPALAREYDATRRLESVRNFYAWELAGTPFAVGSRTVDVRGTGAAPGSLTDVNVTVWRLKSFTVTRTPAHDVGNGCYTFSALGNDAQLFARAALPGDAPRSAEQDFPGPIRLQAFGERNKDVGALRVAERWYGLGRSFVISTTNWPAEGAAEPVPPELLVPADLSHWRYEPQKNLIAVDPVLGRFRFPEGNSPFEKVYVSYCYGAPMPLGGGEYPRSVTEPPGAVFYRAYDDESLRQALKDWKNDLPPDAVIELVTSGTYRTDLKFDLTTANPGTNLPPRSLQIRAAPGKRPILRHENSGEVNTFLLKVKAGQRLTLDGLVFEKVTLHVHGDGLPPGDDCPMELTIRHCTFVPGLSLNCECEPKNPKEPSLVLRDLNGRVRLELSVLGTVEVTQDERFTDPLPIELKTCILDSAALQFPALAQESDTCRAAHAILTLAECTVFGEIHAHAIALADNCIFASRVSVARRQIGCLRFCYVPPQSRTPRRYECQPDRAVAELVKPDDDAITRAQKRSSPQMMSTRFGKADYARLLDAGPPEISRGAEDESEMGVFHDLYEPQRSDNLTTRLAEFVPADAEARLTFAT